MEKNDKVDKETRKFCLDEERGETELKGFFWGCPLNCTMKK